MMLNTSGGAGRPPSPRRRFDESVGSAPPALPAFETGVPMRDDVELAADVYLAKDAGGPAPAIVTMTPYDKSRPAWALDPELYRRNGYAFVLVDVRGRGKSEGEWRAYVHDGRDGYDLVEWVASQPWCTGDVGTTGLSYMGWTQWATAAERPPHLRCMVSTAAAGRWMQEIPYTHGVFQLYFALWTYANRRRISEDLSRVDWTRVMRRLPVRDMVDDLNPSGRTWQDMMEHDRLDEFWRELRIDGRYGRIELPCLHVGGWLDAEDLLGAFHHYESMMRESAAAGRQWLLVGPWSHVGARWPDDRYFELDFGPEAPVEMDEVHLRFFDRWLKGTDNGADRDPAVRLFDTGRNEWRSSDRWPLGQEELFLYLSRSEGRSAGDLGRLPGEGLVPSTAFRYDPMDPATTELAFSGSRSMEPPLDQRSLEARADVVTFSTDPLEQPVTVSGWPRLDLFGSSDADDTDWHVKLTDVHSDGASIRIATGCLRAACRESLSEPSPMDPGKIYRFPVELGPLTHTFLPAHRIRITITSSDFPWFARNMNRFGRVVDMDKPVVATNVIHHTGTYPSRIVLPTEGSEAT